MAWQLLFSSDFGLFSLFVIAFVVFMAAGLVRYFGRKMNEDAKKGQGENSGRK